MKYALLAMIGFFLLAGARGAIGAEQTKGSLKVNGTTISLTHAYAMLYGNEEGYDDGPELRILLSDRELPLTLLSGPVLSGLDDLARKGEIQGILLKLDPRKLAKGSVNGTLLYAPKDPRESLRFFTLSGEAVGFQELKTANNRVVGTTKQKIEGEEFSFEYAASFNAPLVHDKVTARFSGGEALKSPQAQAYLAFAQALREGNFEAARGFSTPERIRRMEEFKAHVGDTVFRDQLKGQVPSEAECRRQIKEVFVRGSLAFIVVQEDGGKSLRPLVLIGKDWKVN